MKTRVIYVRKQTHLNKLHHEVIEIMLEFVYLLLLAAQQALSPEEAYLLSRVLQGNIITS